MQGIQLLSLNEMISHYEKDLKNEKLKIDNFFDFLNEHYAKVIDLEVDDHKKLPFKSELPLSIELAIHHFKLDLIAIHPKIQLKENKSFPENNDFSDDEIKGIWNPPRC